MIAINVCLWLATLYAVYDAAVSLSVRRDSSSDNCFRIGRRIDQGIWHIPGFYSFCRCWQYRSSYSAHGRSLCELVETDTALAEFVSATYTLLTVADFHSSSMEEFRECCQCHCVFCHRSCLLVHERYSGL